jgi:hypothetical protein
MNKSIKVINILSLIFISTFITYQTVYQIGENYFFDKLFFYKSVEHGYWVPDKKLSLEDFGKRSKDLIQLNKHWQSKQDNNILGKTTKVNDDKLTIALIGDSYVWGQGVKYEETLPHLLEKKLNKITKTEVISLAESGDSILDFWENYQKAKEIYNVDLFIFFPVENDLMLNKHRNYKDHIFFWKVCENKIENSEPTYDLDPEDNYLESNNKYYDQVLKDSWTNEFNICLLDHFLENIPREKVIFFISQDPYFYEKNNYHESILAWSKYLEYLKKYNKNMVLLKPNNNTKKYWDSIENFRVSIKETHPSKFAHKIYSETLYEEIINNTDLKLIQ